MTTVIVFLIILSILVFVHELGHFLACKLFKVKVNAFAIGFPPKIWSFTKGETTYAINALPLGGYVSIHGENPGEEFDPNDTRNFQNLSWWKQVIILAAGVIFNVIFAWILLSLSLMIGTSKAALDGLPSEYISGPQKVLIQAVGENSPAKKAGVVPGEVLYSVNGIVVTNATQVQDLIKQSVDKVELMSVLKQSTTTHTVIFEDQKMIGVSLAEVAQVQMPFFAALKYGGAGTWYLTSELGKGVVGFFGKLFVGNASWDEVAGPVGIAKNVGDANREGFTSLLFMSVLISLSLAIMNILPFPALDGGRIVIAVIEGAIRRKLNVKFVNILNLVGFVVLILLMLVVTFKDIWR